jgi:hypothetical protein
MAIDPVTNRVMLVGGTVLLMPVINGKEQALSDTWIWTGSEWSLAEPSSLELRTPEGAFAIAPDLRNGQMLLFTSPEPGVSETWVWRGETVFPE